MPAVRFRHLFAVAAVAVIGAGLAAACGIDLVGSAEPSALGDASTESSRADNGGDGGGVAAACMTLDASCLGALPAGWQPVSIASGASGCGIGFQEAALVVNPRAAAGACACGACLPVGSFTCTGTVAVSGGNTCDDPPIANAVPGACTQASAQHIRGTPPKAGGTVDCVAPNDAGSGATSTDALSLCVPGCDADFCASASRCVIAEGEQACPSGFQLRAHAGTSADPGCPPCACEAGAPGTCGGMITAYSSNDCAATGTVNAYAVGTCNTFSSGNYNSVRPTLVPPTPSCFAVPTAAAPVGDASLVGAKTICCQ